MQRMAAPSVEVCAAVLHRCFPLSLRRTTADSRRIVHQQNKKQQPTNRVADGLGSVS
jgi:hypothetical protein